MSGITTILLLSVSLGVMIMMINQNNPSTAHNCLKITNDLKKKKKRVKKYNEMDEMDEIDNNNFEDTSNTLDLMMDLQQTKKKKNVLLNTEFIEEQFHIDYQDIFTSFNRISKQKELFNLSFLPVKQTEVNQNIAKSLAKMLIKKINQVNKNDVPEYLNKDSQWTDQGKIHKKKSGWDQQMEKLGLPGSLYNEPVGKKKLMMIDLQKTEQFETSDQIRFVLWIIVQKKGVHDQLVVRINLMMNRSDDQNPDNFFSQDLGERDQEIKDVVVEQIFIVGYLTNNAEKKTKMNRFHDYGVLEDEYGFIDQEKVLKIMKKKHQEREKEMKAFTLNVSDEQKEIYDVPSLESYENYRNTRKILDDLKQLPCDSFGETHI